MKFTIGDEIILKRTEEEGRVVAFISDKMVEVEVNNTIFPVHIDDIDHPYFKWFTEKKKVIKKINTDQVQLPVEKSKERKPRLSKGVYLSFMPVFKANETEDIVDYLKVHLLNELPEPIQFVYDVKLLSQSIFKHEGKLQGFGNLYLHNIDYGDMNDQPRFYWRFSQVDDKELADAEDVLRIPPKKLFAQIHELLQKNEPAFSYLLIDGFKPKQKEEKQERFIPLEKPPVSHFSKLLTDFPKYELDLHIEKLVSSIQGMSNADKLLVQLETFRKYLDLAISSRQERMIVIHGKGKGVLREEVHKILKQTPQVKRYANEWHGQYGFGATIIDFRV